MSINHTEELNWRKSFRYGCKSYAGMTYTAEKYLHQYNIEVFGTKSTGQEFLLTITCTVPNTAILEYNGKCITELKQIAEKYNCAVQRYVAKQKRQDIRSLFHLFRQKYEHITNRLYQDTTRQKVRDLEKGVFIL